MTLRPFLSLLSASLVGIFIGTGCAHADATLDHIHEKHEVSIGVVVNGGPFGSIDPQSHALTGWNPDLAREIAKKLGVKVNLVTVQTATRVQFLLSGKVDLLIASMDLTPERADILGHVPTPYYLVDGLAVIHKGSPIKTWEDLRGKPVCVSQGSDYANPLQDKYGAQVKGYRSSAESLLALRGGQCVAAVHDSTLINPTLKGNPDWTDFDTPIHQALLPSYSVVWTRKGETDTIAAVDQVLYQLHRSGWLIQTEKQLGITPPLPLLADLHDKALKSKDPSVLHVAQ